MPVYYVYDSRSGEIVQLVETSGTVESGGTQHSDDEIVALVSAAFKSRPLQVLEVETVHLAEREPGGPGLYVDLDTRTLALHDSN